MQCCEIFSWQSGFEHFFFAIILIHFQNPDNLFVSFFVFLLLLFLLVNNPQTKEKQQQREGSKTVYRRHFYVALLAGSYKYLVSARR